MKLKAKIDQLPLGFMVPKSDWLPPHDLPDLVAMGVKRIALDTEERDDGLSSNRGPGWATGAGYICGVSVAWSAGSGHVQSIYAPTRHPDTACFNPDIVARWLRHLVSAGIEIITQNGPFDWGWLGTAWAIDPPAEGQVHDTLAAAVILDENRISYSLGSLCKWQGVPGKDKSLLLEAGKALGVGSNDREVMAHLWQLPARYVGPYAEGDAEATLMLWNQLEARLRAHGLWDAYRLECDLIPMVVAMRRKGISIDTDYVERQIATLNDKRDQALRELSRRLALRREVTINDISDMSRRLHVGEVDIGNVNSPIWLEKVFTDEGIEFPRTKGTDRFPKGNASFKSDWMETIDHWLPQAVVTANKYHDCAEKFMQGFILNFCHRGRLHADIHHLRSDDEERGFRGGTRSFRFSYSDPPLQQMPSPSRDAELGKIVRGAFRPEPGEQWYKLDFDQNEYRLLVHYAALMHLPKAEEAAQLYRDDPTVSFHKLVMDWTGLAKSDAKNANFAKAYGAGRKKFSQMIKKDQVEADRIFDTYDQELPFVSALYKACSHTARHRGTIRLIDGAQCHFDLWEPGWGYKGKWHPACGLEEANLRVQSVGHPWHGVSLQRAFTHKAMNRLIQGSAARQIKISAREMWREGIVPLLQLHDEWDLSAPDESVARRVRELMEGAVKLVLPVTAGCDTGPNWGEANVEVER